MKDPTEESEVGDMTTLGALTRPKQNNFHHPNCHFSGTNSVAGDFCNCKMEVNVQEYIALRATLAERDCEIAQLKRENGNLSAANEAHWMKHTDVSKTIADRDREIAELKHQLAIMTRERQQDALDGQAALDLLNAQQSTLMKFDPAFGTCKPYPSHASQWRHYHGKAAWLINPWTGERRHPLDIGSDPFGILIKEA